MRYHITVNNTPACTQYTMPSSCGHASVVSARKALKVFKDMYPEADVAMVEGDCPVYLRAEAEADSEDAAMWVADNEEGL